MSTEAPDILSPEFAADPYSAYREMREQHPLIWHEPMQSYVISRYADVERAFKDPPFTSRNYDWQLEPVHGRTILQTDGREHSTHRNLVAPAFRGRDLAEKFVPVIERNSRELIDAFRADGEVDLVDRYATRFPIDVIVDMLGLPTADPEHFHRWHTAGANHAAFALGRHFCVGAMLARTELEIGIAQLPDAMDDIRFADGVRHPGAASSPGPRPPSPSRSTSLTFTPVAA